MASGQAELDAVIGELETKQATLIADVHSALTALENEIKTGTDTGATVSRLRALLDAQTTLDSSVQGATTTPTVGSGQPV